MWFSVSVVPYLISAPAIGAYTDQSRFVPVTYSDRDLCLLSPVLLGIRLIVSIQLVHGRGPDSLVTVPVSIAEGDPVGCSSLHIKAGRVHGIGNGTGKVPHFAPIN